LAGNRSANRRITGIGPVIYRKTAMRTAPDFLP
jgi:hypothetical protein